MSLVRIVSDGTTRNARVEVDGKVLDNVRAFTIHGDAMDDVIRVTLDLTEVEFDILAEEQS